MTETDAPRQADLFAFLKRGARAALVASALFLAACQSIVPKGPATTPPTGPTQPTGPEVVQGLPTDATRHRVALLVPMSGANAGVGQSIANATTLALLDTRTDKVRITTYDTALGAAAAVNRALADGNQLILGPLLAEDARIVGPIAARANVPVISFSNDVGVAGGGVYIMGYNPNQSIDRVVDFARSRGLSQFGALVPRGTYGERAGNALLRAVQQSGGTVVSMQTFDRSAGSMAAAVKKLQASSSYDALLIADSGRVASQVAVLVRKGGGASARLLGTELWNTDAALPSSPALRGAWFASVSDALYRQLAAKYRARYGTTPFRLSSLGYDAVLLTVRIAQVWKPGTAFPSARLRDSGGFSGIDGAFRFTRSGVAERALEVSEVGAGSVTVVDAAPRNFAD
ncbi:ABC-type branched-subunit amino acid transport system substrate-binding protein [Sphingobium sp. OAS761]|uniref:penicillin-binding protein activator n=1 Tax=Sphingobium sp. OAS761 TaxID=2817901 RepID=UPI0020A13EC9|nr:penicillin-binding protein activator [Sphingobium sp. OAS761]MCP1471518.1 ABC-type branched-subunit amino acid transport system substrate-binding protein [Sphingobium sp. OAS761]